MSIFHITHPFRIFWFSILVTVLLGVMVLRFGTLADLWLYLILVVLEVTFSIDNAVINSKILSKMSRIWQFLFLTVGIFIAVFLVRFALPIVIVMVSAGTSFWNVVDLALNDPQQYSGLLHDSSLIINAFGGAFLLMISLGYFFDQNKRRHWLKPLENVMSTIDRRTRYTPLGLMLIIVAALYLTVDDAQRTTVLIAAVLGATIQIGLRLIARLFYVRQAKPGLQVGWAAFASFVYLEVLDASFSFDSVVAAFAITSSVLLIIAGLGAGAIWVRSTTIYLMRSGTLNKYRYLEHGAHWAILALGVVMLAKIYGLELPEIVIGSIGLLFVSSAVITSIVEKRRELRSS